MLIDQTPVQVQESGHCIPAIELEAGQSVYDGFAGRYRKIQEIIKRPVDTIDVPDLAPVRLRWGVLGNALPKHDVLVSPRQKLLVPQRRKRHSRTTLEAVEARDLDILRAPNSTGHDRQVQYVALFFDHTCYVMCSGLLMFGYTPDMLIRRTVPGKQDA